MLPPSTSQFKRPRPMNERQPKQCITDPKRGLMYLRWQDDHESLIPLDTVRQHCPCAECRHLREQNATADPLRVLPANLAQPSTEPIGVQAVGLYALQIFWSDGHQTGIYPWGLLRALCPCRACTGAGGS